MQLAVTIMYSGYNAYKKRKFLILKSILGKPEVYPEKYDIGDEYWFLTSGQKFLDCCSCNYCRKKKVLLEEKLKTINEANAIISDSLDFKNYLKNTMDSNIIRYF